MNPVCQECAAVQDPSLELQKESNAMGEKHVKRSQGKDLLWLVRKWHRLHNIDFPPLSRDISDGQEVCLTQILFASDEDHIKLVFTQ